VRDFLTEEVDRVLIDGEERARRTTARRQNLDTLRRAGSRSTKTASRSSSASTSSAKSSRPGQRKVPLPSGGEIIIDETEALIAIDVNTGSHKNRGGDEKNVIYAVNLEAAAEIARQIRLRNHRRSHHHGLHRHEGAPPP